MRQRMVADFVTVGHGLLPTRQANLQAARRDEEGNLHTFLSQQGQPRTNLTHSRIVKAQVTAARFPVGQWKDCDCCALMDEDSSGV